MVIAAMVDTSRSEPDSTVAELNTRPNPILRAAHRCMTMIAAARQRMTLGTQKMKPPIVSSVACNSELPLHHTVKPMPNLALRGTISADADVGEQGDP